MRPGETLLVNTRARSHTFPEVEFANESIKEGLPDALELSDQYYDEVKAYMPFDPDLKFSVYEAADRIGAARMFTMRIGRRIIGYAVFFVSQMPKSFKTKVAQVDMIFMIKHERRGSLGSEFIRYCDSQLKSEGVQLVYHMTPAKPKHYGPVLERMGYRMTEHVYARRLD